MSRPIPNVTLGGYRPNQVKINSIGIGIDDATLNSLNLDSSQFMVVGGQTDDIYNMVVDSEGVIINSSIVNRAAHSNEYALFVDGNIFVSGKVETSAGTLSNVAGTGSGGACNFWMPVRERFTTTNIFYDGKINVANEAQSRGNAYRVNIIDNANRTITHSQLAIQNQVGSVGRSAILGYSNLSPLVFNTSYGAIEFHVARDQNYFTSTYYRSNVIAGVSNYEALDMPNYTSNGSAPHLVINRDGNVGIKVSPNPPLTYLLKVPDSQSPPQISYTSVTGPADLHVDGTTYACNMLVYDRISSSVQNIDEIYVRRLGVTFAASQVEPGYFAPGDYTFRSNVSIGGPIEPEYILSVKGLVHFSDALFTDGLVQASNIITLNTTEMLGSAYFEKDIVVNENMQVNQNLVIWGGLYADSNSIQTIVPGGSNSNSTVPVSFVGYVADGWSNIYPVGAGFVTPGKAGVGINSQYDTVPSQLTVTSRDSNIYALGLIDKTNPVVTKGLFIGHQRSNIINGTIDASVLFSTPSSTSTYFVANQQSYPQNMYFYPGMYDKRILGGNTVTISTPPTFSIYETGQVGVNTFQPDSRVQMYVNGSIAFTSNIYGYDTDRGVITPIAQFKYVPTVGIGTEQGVRYIDADAPYVGIHCPPDSRYGMKLQGSFLADSYYAKDAYDNHKRAVLWLDSAATNADSIPTVTDGAYVLGKVGVGVVKPWYMLDICDNLPGIGNSNGTYIRLAQSTMDYTLSNVGVRFDVTRPWFTNVEDVSANVSRYHIGSAADVYKLVDAQGELITINWASNFSVQLGASSNLSSSTSYTGPVVSGVTTLPSYSSNVVNTSNVTNLYNIVITSNVTSNTTSNVNNIPGVPFLTYSVSVSVTDSVMTEVTTSVMTTSNYGTPLAPSVSNIVNTSNIINTSNYLTTSNVQSYLNTSNYFLASNTSGIMVQHDLSRDGYPHQVVVGGNASLLDHSLYNPNPNPYATLTVNGDTSIMGNLNVSGYITANGAVTMKDGERSNVPTIQADDLFISGKDVFVNPTNKMYINYTCNMLSYPIESGSKAMLNVYQDIYNSITPAPIAHFIGKGDNAFIEIVSEQIMNYGNTNDGVLRIGLVTGDMNGQTIGFQDGGGNPYMTFRKNGNTQRAMGINTFVPSAQLHIVNDSSGINNNMLRVTYDNGNTGDTASYTPNLMLEKKYTEGNSIAQKQWLIQGPTYGTNMNDQLSFTYVKINSLEEGGQVMSSNTVLSLTSNGCIGLNTTTPAYMLDVVTTDVQAGRNNGIRLWNKDNSDTAQIVFQSGNSPDVGGDVYTDYVMYSCNSEFVFRQRNSETVTYPLMYFGSNTNIGINAYPNPRVSVNIGGTLNVTDAILINGQEIFRASGSNTSNAGSTISSDQSIYLLPNVYNFGGVVINNSTSTNNIFHLFNDNTYSGTVGVFDSYYNNSSLYFRNYDLSTSTFNLYEQYTYNNTYGIAYKPMATRTNEITNAAMSNVFHIDVVAGTAYTEHDMHLQGNLNLASAVRGVPKVSFGAGGEIGGVDATSSMYILPGSGSNLGIGTTMPAAPLHVQGTSVFGASVGIGTTLPQKALSVHGNAMIGQGLGGSNLSTVGGPFFLQNSWGPVGTTHTIAYPNYCVGDNSAGTMYIQVSNKSADPVSMKMGTLQVSFIKLNDTNVNVSEISSHKNTNLGTLSVSGSTNDIVVTTDSDCYISWTCIGSY